MIVGATAHNLIAALRERSGQRSGVCDDRLAIRLEFRAQRLEKRHRFGGNDMLERAALCSRENGFVDCLRMHGLTENQSAARAAQCLVRRAGNDIGHWHRIRIHASRRKSGEVRHVNHKNRTDFLGNRRESRKVDHARVRRISGDNHFWLVLACQRFHAIVIDERRIGQAVMHSVI